MRTSITALLLVLGVSSAAAEDIGSVDTAFKWLGANHKIVVEVFDDPSIEGVSCYLSRAKTGGISGSLGIAEDTSDASVACRQVGESITIKNPIKQTEQVFTERASILFKNIHVVRMVDEKRKVLTYLVYSNKFIDGSPKNSITAVPLPGNVNLAVSLKK